MKNLIFLSALCLMFILSSAIAQIPPDKDVLLNAKGAGQAKYAENNGYPGPRHVLDMAQTLGISLEQKEKIQAIFDEMEIKAKDVGKKIIQIEEELNNAFRDGLASEKAVMADAQDIGRLRGKLRAIHLIAHLKTKKLLTEKQIQLYVKLRSAENEK